MKFRYVMKIELSSRLKFRECHVGHFDQNGVVIIDNV